ncbi:HGxxPAAW family protein [Streptomyces sp. NBC_00258]|uniref:HGxxPAAW family protein n=1 Tax=Streptomyces sp. NBC_00258 TaxID=2903642 RepID=UPI002E29D29A|nr:HGxxPAAW family protein [Streptomyces sp. NBC_00258]
MLKGHHHDEGHTVAGWTGCAVAVVGTSVAGVGMCLGSAAGIWLGLGVVGLGVLVTWGLHLAGWGKPPGIRPVAERGMRVRDRAARAGHPACVGCRLAGRGRSVSTLVAASAQGVQGVRGAQRPDAASGSAASASAPSESASSGSVV